MHLLSKRPSKRAFAAVVAAGLLLPLVGIQPASAAEPDFTPGKFVSPTLEGCRGTVDPSFYVPLNGPPAADDNPFICPDSMYTTGNLGKGWNELDLVPHRLTTALGNQATATEEYDLILAADNELGSYEGYDTMTIPVVNAAKSDASCMIVAQDQKEGPGLQGGVDTSIYRVVSVQQDKGSICVFDYDLRLSNSASEFSGSSLQSYLFQQADLSGGNRTLSIPVKDVLPQTLDKSATAVRGQRYGWTIAKEVTPGQISIPNTCAMQESGSEVKVEVNWTRTGPAPEGKVAYHVDVTATNPAKRPIQVTVNDWIYENDADGLLLADPSGSGGIQVAPELSALIEPGTHTVGSFDLDLDSDAPAIYDEAVGEYFDPVLQTEIKPDKDAQYTATVGSGDSANASATVTDYEEIDTGFEFKVVSINGAAGPNEWVSEYAWEKADVTDSGSVTFIKNVRVTQSGSSGSATLSDTATIQGVDDDTASEATGSTNVIADKLATITVNKETENVFGDGESATFTFKVYVADSNGDPIGIALETKTVTVDANTPDPDQDGLLNSKVEFTGLTGGKYVVREMPVVGWKSQEDVLIDLTGFICSADTGFVNDVKPAKAKVKKVTVPAGFESGWTFDLKQGDDVIETKTTTDTGYIPFDTELDEGTYSVVEQGQDGWDSDGGSADCTFTVDLPAADADRVFSCDFTNSYEPEIKVVKQGDALAKHGDNPIDDIDYEIKVKNTSPSPVGAAGAPKLTCTLDDTPIDELDVTLDPIAPGESETAKYSYKVPEGTEAGDFVNTVAVTCEYPDGSDANVTTSADSTLSATTGIFVPSVKVTKTVDVAEAMVGDTVNFTVKIKNTSSDNTPTLELNEFADTLVPGATPDATCQELDSTESCTFNYSYTVLSGDASVSNTATAKYTIITPDGANLDGSAFPNVLSDSGRADFTVVSPGFTVAKECTSPLVAPGGKADFDVTFVNTGDVPLDITANDGIGSFVLAVGETKTFQVQDDVPALGGAATVTNKVTATAAYKSLWTKEKSAEDSCSIGAYAEVVKTTSGVDTTANDYVWPFKLYEDTSHSVDVGTEIGSGQTDGSGAGTIKFTALLDPSEMYTICEEVDTPSAAWSPEWRTVTVNGTTIPIDPADVWNPDEFQDPSQSLGRSCLDIGATTSYPIVANRTTSVAVDNKYQSQGGQRTIGYWKNWNTCSGGNQEATAEKLGGTDAGRWLLDNTLPMMLGEWDLVQCADAVSLLGKSPIDSKKVKASDGLYNMAAQLIAAKANVTAGSGCSLIEPTIADADALLAKYGFDGTGSYLPSKVKTDEKKADRMLANELANTLDEFNNGLGC